MLIGGIRCRRADQGGCGAPVLADRGPSSLRIEPLCAPSSRCDLSSARNLIKRAHRPLARILHAGSPSERPLRVQTEGLPADPIVRCSDLGRWSRARATHVAGGVILRKHESSTRDAPSSQVACGNGRCVAAGTSVGTTHSSRRPPARLTRCDGRALGARTVAGVVRFGYTNAHRNRAVSTGRSPAKATLRRALAVQPSGGQDRRGAALGCALVDEAALALWRLTASKCSCALSISAPCCLTQAPRAITGTHRERPRSVN